jgi:hypothetical protein
MDEDRYQKIVDILDELNIKMFECNPQWRANSIYSDFMIGCQWCPYQHNLLCRDILARRFGCIFDKRRKK